MEILKTENTKLQQLLKATTTIPSLPSISTTVQTPTRAKKVTVKRKSLPTVEPTPKPSSPANLKNTPLCLLESESVPPLIEVQYSTPILPVVLGKGQKENVMALSATTESAVLLPQQSELREVLALFLLMALLQTQDAISKFQVMFLSLWTSNSLSTQALHNWILSGILSKITHCKIPQISLPSNQHLLLPSYLQTQLKSSVRTPFPHQETSLNTLPLFQSPSIWSKAQVTTCGWTPWCPDSNYLNVLVN